jgi:hypothetical protein
MKANQDARGWHSFAGYTPGTKVTVCGFLLQRGPRCRHVQGFSGFWQTSASRQDLGRIADDPAPVGPPLEVEAELYSTCLFPPVSGLPSVNILHYTGGTGPRHPNFGCLGRTSHAPEILVHAGHGRAGADQSRCLMPGTKNQPME